MSESSKKPFFSILVTGYNARDYVGECLRSVQNQSVTDFECLVGDDASTDAMYETAAELVGNDERFILLRSEVNKGGGENIVNLIRHARGEICVELGADDYFLSEGTLKRIRDEYGMFEKCDCTSGSFVIVPSGGIVCQKPDQVWWRRWTFAKALTWRTEVMLKALDEFWPTIIDPETKEVPRYGWDVAIYYPLMALSRRHRTIHDIIYAYRIHEENDAKNHREDQLVTERRMSLCMENRFLQKPMPWWPEELRKERGLA